MSPVLIALACGGSKPAGNDVAQASDDKVTPTDAKPRKLVLADAQLESADAAVHAAPMGNRPPAPRVQPAGGTAGDIAYPEGFNGNPSATTMSAGGVKIEDFAVGTGAAVKAGDEIRVHYTGWTGTGDKFDSSLDRNKPFTFPFGAGRVIKGWDEGLAGMKVGGKRRLTIPPEMGYGARQAGKIPPNSTLIFAVELLEVVPPLPDPKPAEAFKGTPVRSFKTEGGTKVDVYAEGTGAVANKGDTVSVHYTGTLDDGTEFDSSIPRKKAIEIPIGTGRVIKGWDEGIVGMKVGELRKLTIPAASGYGERAAGKIPPNSRLTFTVELMRVTPAGK